VHRQTDPSSSKSNSSRKKYSMNDVTFSIASHRTKGTKSQSSDYQGRHIIAGIQRGDDRKRKKNMKLSTISSGLLLGVTLLLATGASAASKGSLKLNEAVSVNGTQLAKGEYEIMWEGTGPNVELNVIQSKKIVVTVPARLVELKRAGPGQGYGTRKEEDGRTSLTSIFFSGKKYEVAIGKGQHRLCFCEFLGWRRRQSFWASNTLDQPHRRSSR
jgi:hypothetical protein